MFLTFENPLYLWLFFSIPLFIISHFFFLRNSKSKALKFANVETIRRISGEKLITKNITHLVIRVLIIFFLILAVAGTKFWIMGSSTDVNIVVALDSSASMTSEDVAPNRFDASKTGIKRFVDSLSMRTNIGLVTFAGVTFVDMTLTESRSDFRFALDNARISSTGGTDIAGAIIASTNLLLTQPERGKSILLVSDGVNTIGAFISDPLREAVEYAKRNQVIIYTVGIGTDSGPVGYLPDYYNISSMYNEENMMYIARETGGQYIYAADANSIIQAVDYYAEKSDERFISFDLSFGALLLALSLLFLEWGLANTIYRRIL